MFTLRKCSTLQKVQSSNLQKLDHGDACAVSQLRHAIEALDFSIEDAAQFCGVSTSTMWRWTNGLVSIDAGKLKAIVIEAGVPSMREIPKAVSQ